MAALSRLVRVLEPEVMDSPEEAEDYDSMDHGEVNARFVEDLLKLSPDLSRVLDVGTGTARIPLELVKRMPTSHVLALDLAPSMLEVARRNVARANANKNIELSLGDAKSLRLGERVFSCVISNSIIHHIPDPPLAFSEMVKLVAPGGHLFLRDLSRPEEDRVVLELVDRYASGATALQRALLEASLRAALTVEEIVSIVAPLGIDSSCIGMTSDRHWTLSWRRPAHAN